MTVTVSVTVSVQLKKTNHNTQDASHSTNCRELTKCHDKMSFDALSQTLTPK